MNYSMYSIWDELRRFSLEKGGGEFRTTLLGDVPKGWIGYELVGVVPNWVIVEAHNNGFEVVAANWEDNTYTLRELNGH
jgi:hypothetical protein